MNRCSRLVAVVTMGCGVAISQAQDLTITDVQFSPTPEIGKKFTAYVTVKNIGTSSSGSCYLDGLQNGYFRGTTKARGDVWALVPGLSKGTSKQVTLSGLDAGTDGKARTFGAFIDSQLNVMESNNEGNNTYKKSYTPIFVNLYTYPANMTVSPSVPTANRTATFTTKVTNTGTKDSAATTVKIWFDKGWWPWQSPDVTTSIGVIKAGQTVTAATTTRNVGGAGTKNWVVQVDPDNKVYEVNEGDNTTTKTYTVR